MSVSDEDEVGDAGGYGDWSDEDNDPAQSLFSDQKLPNSAAAIAHDAKHHNFDLARFRTQRRLDEYGVIRVINYIRSEIQSGHDPLPALLGASEAAPWDGDCYLKPVLQDDAMLMHDFEEEVDEEDTDPICCSSNTKNSTRSPVTAFGEVRMLREQNQALRDALRASACCIEEGRDGDGAELAWDSGYANGAAPGDDRATSDAAVSDPMVTSLGSSNATASRATGNKQAAKQVSFAAAHAAEAGRVDDSYFESYSYLDIHREMLSDTVRTEAYRDALEQNPSLMKNAIVLDVGCGTGILSLFAARAGAPRVIGIDGSARMAAFASRIAIRNGLSSQFGGPLTIVSGKVEALEQLPGGVEKVDVLVSEWMGYALLFESMLDSVIVARNRFLKPGGAMLPDVATIYLAGGGCDAGGLGFWKDMYGFDMAILADALTEASYKDAVVAGVKGEHLVTGPVAVKTLDLATMDASDADFTAPFQLRPLESSSAAVACCSIVVWFDVEFSSRFCKEHPVTLTTSPAAPQTHWVQALLTFRKPILLQRAQPSSNPSAEQPAAAIRGRISMVRSNKHRSLDISLEYSAVSADGVCAVSQLAIYELAVSGAKG